MSINTLTHKQNGIDAHLQIGCDTIQGTTGTFDTAVINTAIVSTMDVHDLVADLLTLTNQVSVPNAPINATSFFSNGIGNLTQIDPIGTTITYATSTATGPIGPTGPTGPTGHTGATGPTGPMVVPKYNMVAGPIITNVTGPSSLLGTGHVGSATFGTGTIAIDNTVVFHSTTVASAIDNTTTLTFDLLCNGSSIWTTNFANITADTGYTFIIDIQLTNIDNSNSYISSSIIDGNFTTGWNTFLQAYSQAINTLITNVFGFQLTSTTATTGTSVQCQTFRIDLEQF